MGGVKAEGGEGYRGEQVLDDGGQSLHAAVPLQQQPPQLDRRLVLPLLFVLLLRSAARARSGAILKAGSSFWALPGPGSCSEPGGAGGVSSRQNRRPWRVSVCDV